ncbi:MAG TPA: SpoIIE family protein phosphatase [Candidatus Acidoferrales bacterium]|nr:SpoIIE family protein phosphatase [Candidatus Acidoferrales bacterium]
MLSLYLQFVYRTQRPALLWKDRHGLVSANARAQEFVNDFGASEGLFGACRRVASSARLERERCGDAEFTLVPLIDQFGRTEAVLAIGGVDEGELPLVLHDVYGTSRHFSQLMHLLPQIVLTAQPGGDWEYASRRWYDVTGDIPARNDVAAGVWNATGERANRFGERWREGVESREPFSFEFLLTTATGARWYDLRALPCLQNGHLAKWIVTLDDVHEKVVTRESLAAANKRLEVLAEVGAILLDPGQEPGESVPRALAAAAASLDALWIASFDFEGTRTVAGYPAEARMYERVLQGSDELSGVAVFTYRWNGNDPRYVVKVPLDLGPGRHTLAVVAPGGREPFDEHEIHLVREVALRLSSAIQSRIAFRREARVAAVLQRAMLPVSLPQPFGVRFDVGYRPAESQLLVGGDWYDAFELPDGRVAFSIGDVAGHGLEAATTMGHVRETLRDCGLQGLSPGDALAHTNAGVFARGHELITALLGYLDPLTLRVEYACAGHTPPYVVEADGSWHPFACSGVILGAVPRAEYETQSMRLTQGAALVLYTDGLLEFARDIDRGEQQLRRVLARWGGSGFGESAAELLDAVLNGEQAEDDTAILVVRALPLARIDASVPAQPSSAPRARAAIGRVLADAVCGERAGDFLLAMCEGVNNAIEHGSRSAQDRVHFSVSRDTFGLHGAITSSGPWVDHTPSIERGRGLMLMRALADKFEIKVDEHGTTVDLQLDAPAQHGALRA